MLSELVGQNPKRNILPATRLPTQQMSILTYAHDLFQMCAFQGASKKKKKNQDSMHVWVQEGVL